jgi:asparagine synthase (glutamine-hydrolysing)
VNFSELSSGELAAKALQRLWARRNRTSSPASGLLGGRLSAFPTLAPNGTTTEAQLYLNMTQLKMPYWLRSNDKIALAIPVEVRAPLLDYRLVEFAFQLPTSFLIRNGWLKWILRRAMDDLLPPTITWRRKKMGYPFPLQDWLQNSMRIINLLLKESDNPYINTPSIRENLGHWVSTRPELVWRILSLELWHRHLIRGERLLLN